jgi:hypothetical protein
MNDAERQAELYTGIWEDDPSYGTKMTDVVATIYQRVVPHMLRLFNSDRFYLKPGIHVADFGAGDARFLRELESARFCYRGTAVDVYKPKNPPEWIDWRQVPMWEAGGIRADYAISTDALEHLPPDRVQESLDVIRHSAPHGFLRISLKEDRYGTERGLHLHESVFTSQEWLVRLCRAGIVVTSYRVYLDDPATEAALEVWY